MKKNFSWRAFISFGLGYLFFLLLLSGIMLYVSPPGRYAHWVNWTLWGLSKEGWQGVHIIFSLAFVILSVLHLFWINWKAFLSYMKSKKTKGFQKKWELLSATLLILVFFLGTLYAVPPFKNVLDLGETLTASWEKVEERAPVPHAELLTLADLTEQLQMPSVDELTRKLDNHQIKYENTGSQTLQEIAEANQSTPIEVYAILTKQAGNQREGAGIGRKTIEDFATELGKSTDEVLATLKANNIKASRGETLRAIGENNNLPPRDVYKLISE